MVGDDPVVKDVDKESGGEDDDGLGRLFRQVECHTAEVVKMMLL